MKLSWAEAIMELNKLEAGDAEATHGRADEILLSQAPAKVREAYEQARKRCGFWYA